LHLYSKSKEVGPLRFTGHPGDRRNTGRARGTRGGTHTFEMWVTDESIGRSPALQADYLRSSFDPLADLLSGLRTAVSYSSSEERLNSPPPTKREGRGLARPPAPYPWFFGNRWPLKPSFI